MIADHRVTGRLVRAVSRGPVHVAIIGLALLWMIPTLSLFVSSFRPRQEITSSGWWSALNPFSEHFTFTIRNYADVLSQENMTQSFLNSLYIALPSTAIVILVAALAAYAFAWMRFPGRDVLFLITVGLLVVPLQMTLIPVFGLFSDPCGQLRLGSCTGLSLAGTYPAVWLAHTAYGLPFAVFLLRNFFGALPRDLFESAFLDGASEIGVFFRIVLPLSVPALAALAIFQFMWVWNDLLVALVYLSDSLDKAPMTLTISNLVGRFASDQHLLTSAAFVSMGLPLVIFFALQRYFVQGILAGSVKG